MCISTVTMPAVYLLTLHGIFLTHSAMYCKLSKPRLQMDGLTHGSEGVQRCMCEGGGYDGEGDYHRHTVSKYSSCTKSYVLSQAEQ